MRAITIAVVMLMWLTGCVSVQSDPINLKLTLLIDGKPASGWQIVALSLKPDGRETRYGPWMAGRDGAFDMRFPLDVQVRNRIAPRLEFPSIFFEVAPPNSSTWYRVNPAALVNRGSDLVCESDGHLPNQSLEPTPTSVMPRADARVTPAVSVAQH